jgi:hypothetical protein
MGKEDIKKHQFKKGQSGNPKGKPKGTKNVKTQLREMLSAASPTGDYSHPLAEQLIKIALGGEKDSDKLKAIESITAKIEGQLEAMPQQLDLSQLNKKDLAHFKELAKKATPKDDI